MLTTAECYGLIIAVMSLALSGTTVYAQATNQADRVGRASGQLEMASLNMFEMGELTLTGAVLAASTTVIPQSLAELKWRLKYALDAKNDRAALEYSTVSLIGSPEEERQLMRAKAVALVKLRRIPDAIATLKYVLIMEPNDTALVDNVAELLLITGQISEYRTFASKHKERIDRAYDGVLSKYFSILDAYQSEDEDQFRATAARLLASLPAKNEPLLAGWTFDDLLEATSKQPGTHKRAMLMNFVLVLMGDLSRDDALKMNRSL